MLWGWDREDLHPKGCRNRAFWKAEVFANINLTRNTVAERISDISANLDSQLKKKSVVCYIFGCARWKHGYFRRCTTSHIHSWRWWDFVTEEFLGLVPMIDTITANDIFNSLVGVLNRMGIYWSRAVGIATDSAPSMIANKAGVATKVR